MIADVKTNKVRNEEFKIWKKSLPSLYQHITTLQPSFSSKVEELNNVQKTVTFSDEVKLNREKGLLESTLYYSLAGDVYEIALELPLGTYSSGEQELPQPNYDNFVSDPLQPKWTYQGENITKIQKIRKSNSSTCETVVMSDNGSLAWLQNDCKVPVKVLSEIMGPSTSFSMIHSLKEVHNGMIADFDISPDMKTILKSQSIIAGNEGHSILKLIDNAERPGELLRTVHVPGTTVTSNVRFHNNHLFSSCSDDNTLRFWDMRANEAPIWTMKDISEGNLTSYDVSSTIDTLFATGSDTGAVKLWDLRSIVASSKENEVHSAIVTFFQPDNDGVVDVQFEKSDPENIITVGKTGNVHHWNLQPLTEEYADDDEEATKDEAYYELLQSHCLKFLHTGGGRRSYGDLSKRGTVALHPSIDGLVATVDNDGFLSVYKGFYGRDDESENGDTVKS